MFITSLVLRNSSQVQGITGSTSSRTRSPQHRKNTNTESAKHRILRLRLAALRLAAFGSILRLLRLRLAAFCVWGFCVCLRLGPVLRLLRLALLRLGLVCTILRLA